MREKYNLFKDLVSIDEAPGALVSWPLTLILRALGKDFMRQLNDDLAAMGERGYWHRLWIVQEIAAGSEKVRVLCGTDMISPVGLYLLLRHLDGPGYYRDVSCRLFDQAMTSTVVPRISARKLNDIFVDYADARCSDARDKIYGVLGLIDWNEHNLIPIQPDYNKSVWDLALQLIRYTRSMRLLWAFQITSRSPEMQELSKSRSLLHQQTSSINQTSPQDYCVHDQLIHRRHLAARLKTNSQQDLELDHADIAYDSRPNPARKRAQGGLMRACKEMSQGPNVSPDMLPKAVYVDGAIAAIICAAARAGDLMVNAGYEDVCLVVRRNLDHRQGYDVVGQAVVVNGYRIARVTHSFWLDDPKLSAWIDEAEPDTRCDCLTTLSEPQGSFWADIKIRWTHEDAMLLAGQDLLPNRDVRDVDGKLARLTTRTLSDPIGAISMDRLVDLCTQCKKLRRLRQI